MSEDLLENMFRRLSELYGARSTHLTQENLMYVLGFTAASMGRTRQYGTFMKSLERIEEPRDVALAFSDHARALRNHENRLKVLESAYSGPQDLLSVTDVKARAFKVLLEDKLRHIDGVLCVFANAIKGMQELTIIVENGRSAELLEPIIGELVTVHDVFPEVTYDFEVGEIGLVDLDDYSEQDLVLDCRGVTHGHSTTVP